VDVPGPKATKFVHQWMGPLKVVEPVGYENFVLRREDQNGVAELIVAHASFLVGYQSPVSLLPQIAADIEAQLEYEDLGVRGAPVEATRAAVRTASSAGRPRPEAAAGRRVRDAATPLSGSGESCVKLVELRRRKRRNRAGQYILEHELRPVRSGSTRLLDGGRWTSKRVRRAVRWVGATEFDRMHDADRVVEAPAVRKSCNEVPQTTGPAAVAKERGGPIEEKIASCSDG